MYARQSFKNESERGRKIFAVQIGDAKFPFHIQAANGRCAKRSSRHVGVNRTARENRYAEAKLYILMIASVR